MSYQESWIEFEDDRYSLEEIKHRTYPDSLPHFKQTSLDFCHDWLNGKETFELTTSGTTGTPKIIITTRSQLMASAALSASAVKLQKTFTALVCLDTRYIAGFMMLIRSLEVGMNMIIVEPTSNPFEKTKEESRIDFTALVPYQLETILKSPHKERLNQVKVILIGGAAINPTTVKEIRNMSCQFFFTYGMTETLSHVALQKLNGINAQEYFEALPGIKLSQDERGCLVIQAPHISINPIITNDLVELKSPSQFRWMGRVDHIINTGGVKVIPEKVERSIGIALSEVGVLVRFFVGALPDRILGEAVTLFMEGPPLSIEVEELIQSKIKLSLDRYERPKSICYVSAFMNTDSGKIDKQKTIITIKAE